MNKLSYSLQSSEQIIQNFKNIYIELKDLSSSILFKINNINSELKDYELKYISLNEELLKIKRALQNISNFEKISKDGLDEITSFIHKIKQFHNENNLSDETKNKHRDSNAINLQINESFSKMVYKVKYRFRKNE